MERTINVVSRVFGLVLVAFLINAVIGIKFGSIKSMIYDAPKSYVSVENVDRTLSCLALNIYKEAGNESFEGKVAVAQVTLNRTDHPSFPKDVCNVVYQKNVFMSKVVCQFSWHCINPGKINTDTNAYKESYAVAKKVLLEGFRLDGLKDALYYHAVYVNPNWPYKRIITIGNHIFYKG